MLREGREGRTMQSGSQVELGGDRPLATFSRVKFKLQNLLLELNRLREYEISTKLEVEQLHEKQMLLETDHADDKKQYEAELAAAIKGCREFENIVKQLKSDMIAAEVREQTSKRELNKLLQLRNTVTEQFKVENQRLQLSLHQKSHELGEALDKLRRHSKLVEAVETGFTIIKRSVDEAHRIIGEKEESLARLQTKLDYVACEDNNSKLLERIRSLEKQLDACRKSEVARETVITNLEQKLERGKSDHTLQEQLSFAKGMNELKDSTISRLSVNVQALETQISAMEIVVTRTQERMKWQEDLLERTRRELLDAENIADCLRARLEEAGKYLTSYAETCKKLESSTSVELRRSAELQTELEGIIKRYNLLELQQKKNSGLEKTTSVKETVSLCTCTSDLIATQDQSTCTRDLQGSGQHGDDLPNTSLRKHDQSTSTCDLQGEGNRDQIAEDDLSKTYFRKPLHTEKTDGNKKSPDSSDKSKCQRHKMKATRDRIRYLSTTRDSPRLLISCNEPGPTEDLAIVTLETDEVTLNSKKAMGAAENNQPEGSSAKNFPGKLQEHNHRENFISKRRLYDSSTAFLSKANLLATCVSECTSLAADSAMNKDNEHDNNTALISPKGSPLLMSTFSKGTGRGITMRESDASAVCGDESCASIANCSRQPEVLDRHPKTPTRRLRATSPDLEFDVENLLKQDLFPDLVFSGRGREDIEWVYTDTEAGVTFSEHVPDPGLPAEFILDSYPDSQETIKKRRLGTKIEGIRRLNDRPTNEP